MGKKKKQQQKSLFAWVPDSETEATLTFTERA